MRRAVVAVALAVVCLGLAGAATIESPTSPGPATEPAEGALSEQLVPLEGDGYVWPYTSRRRSTSGRTLALNVVVRGSPERTRRLLTDRSDVNWSSVDPVATERVAPWQSTHGSTRYGYVAPDRNATGRWSAADYQLDVGTYFGQRTHIRGYGGYGGERTALQAHTEYWDWFRLRHTVTGVRTGARVVERDLGDVPGVEVVPPERSDGAATDGSGDTDEREGADESGHRWTVVYLSSATLLGGVVVSLRNQRERDGGGRPGMRELGLAVGLVAVVLGVRAWGLAAEAALPGVTPKPFAAFGYAALVLGPPAVVREFAPGTTPRRAALLAAAGVSAGIAIDFAVVGVHRVPDRLLFHRAATAAALGLLAAGVADGDRRVVGLGGVAWLVGLVAVLFGLY